MLASGFVVSVLGTRLVLAVVERSPWLAGGLELAMLLLAGASLQVWADRKKNFLLLVSEAVGYASGTVVTLLLEGN